jgi:hypothetical protein
MLDKRQFQRRAVDAAAQVATPAGDAWQAVRLLDISESGAAFAFAERAIVDTVRRFEIRLPDSPEPIRVDAKIVNRSPLAAGFRVGVAFVSIGAADAARIRHFVAAH